METNVCVSVEERLNCTGRNDLRKELSTKISKREAPQKVLSNTLFAIHMTFATRSRWSHYARGNSCVLIHIQYR
eukprot:scaffold13320_cov215-Alexandrium_tamarense.AAC.24